MASCPTRLKGMTAMATAETACQRTLSSNKTRSFQESRNSRRRNTDVKVILSLSPGLFPYSDPVPIVGATNCKPGPFLRRRIIIDRVKNQGER